MQTSDVISIIALVLSFIGSVASVSFSVFYTRKQIEIMRLQLAKDLEKKFTDDPNNAYTANLANIAKGVYSIATSINETQNKKLQ